MDSKRNKEDVPYWEKDIKKKKNKVNPEDETVWRDPKGTTGGGLKIKYVRTRATFSTNRHYFQACLLLISLANAVSINSFKL